MRVLPCGPGLLLEFDDGPETTAYAAGLRESPVPGVVETVPASRTVLLRVEEGADLAAVAARAREVTPRDVTAGGAETLEIPVRYDGEDLHDAADRLDIGVEELVHRHTAGEWTVAFCGFAPGFGYLVDPSQEWSTPRRDSPRPAVPPGSVALAAEYSAVYPRQSPGGWQLIGTTDEVLLDTHADPPARLAPGTNVRFVDVTGRAS